MLCAVAALLPSTVSTVPAQAVITRGEGRGRARVRSSGHQRLCSVHPSFPAGRSFSPARLVVRSPWRAQRACCWSVRKRRRRGHTLSPSGPHSWSSRTPWRNAASATPSGPTSTTAASSVSPEAASNLAGCMSRPDRSPGTHCCLSLLRRMVRISPQEG